jgi:hypothetical protein
MDCGDNKEGIVMNSTTGDGSTGTLKSYATADLIITDLEFGLGYDSNNNPLVTDLVYNIIPNPEYTPG